MPYKLVFWDWMGTLYAHDLLRVSRLKNLILDGSIKSDLDLDNLDFHDAVLIKNELKRFKGSKIPFTWFLVNAFSKADVFQVIISNGVEESILSCLDDFNPFDLVLTSDRFNPKPNVEMLEFACETLNFFEKDKMLFIGDTLVDQKVAENFEILFFRITDYYESAYKIAKELDLL